MKPKPIIALLTGWLAFAIAPTDARGAGEGSPAGAANRPMGTITGRVSNAGTGVFLDGAQITLQPFGRTTLTARDGQFMFSQVPAGTYQLTVTYTGLPTGNATISVTSGETITQDFSLTAEIYKLGEFVVSGEREGTSRAIQLQRHAPNVKNILSSDAFGNIADDNMGNFMRRLPGITISELEGSPRAVQIRGMPGDLNAITIDGSRAANGRTTGAAASGEARSFDLDTISAEAIETIEVTKAPTSDMDADSVGGSVNLVTKSAFDRKGRSLTYRIASTHNIRRDTYRPALTFSYSDLFGEKQNFGIMLTANYNRSIRSRDSYRTDHEETTDTNRTAFWLVGELREDGLTYDRAGVSLRLDYKLAQNSTVFLSGQYNDNKDTLRRSRTMIQPTPTTIPLQVFTRYDANGVARTATNAVARILPGWTDKQIETINSNFTADQNLRDAWVQTLGVIGGGELRFASAKLNYNVSYSHSRGANDRVIMGTQVQNVGFRFSKKPENWGGLASYEQISGPDVFNWANRRISSYNLQNDTKEDEMLGAAINLHKDLALPAPTYVKTGLRIRAQAREHDLERPVFNFVGTGNVQRFQDINNTYKPFDGLFPNAGFLDPKLMAAEMQSSPGSFTENVVSTTRNSLTSDFSAEEDVYAAYVMGGTRLGRLNILSGLRVEETRVHGTGNIQMLTREELARRAAWVGPVTPDEQRRRTIAESGNSRANKGKYRNAFPSVHFRYELSKGMLARASYSSGIGRPNFGNLVPRDSVDDANQRVEANNPKLKPQYVDNFDLSLEYYFEPAGMVSVGAFLKEMDDFIFRADGLTIPEGADNGFDGDFAGYKLSTWSNGGGARVRGVEVSYQQQFSFLPGFWRGFGIFSNFTWIESAGNFGELGRPGFLPGFTPRSGTAGLTYVDHGWTLRLIATYNSENAGAFSVDPSQQTINRIRRNVDLNVRYNVNRWYSVFCDVQNLTDEHRGNNYVFIPSRQFQYQRYSSVITFGISGRF